MKVKRVLKPMFVIMFVFTLCLSSATVFAKANNVSNLLSKIDKINQNEMDDSISKLYKNEVAPSLIARRQDLVYSDVSDQAITDATLSEPLPILATNVKYMKGEDFKSKLKHSGWQFIVNVDNKPIAVFSVDKQNAEYAVTNVMNENFAKAISDALGQLNGSPPVILPIGGYFFIADSDDNVALARLLNDNIANAKYELKTFDELNNAENRTIDYYSNQTEVIDGGSVVIDYLYGDSTGSSSPSKNYVIFIVVGVAFLISIIILFRNRRSKINNN